MSRLLAKRIIALGTIGLLLGTDSAGIGELAHKGANRLLADNTDPIVLSAYNCEDYIAEDEKDDSGNVTEKGLISKFEDYCAETLGQNVTVAYSTYDTNETMLSELKTGKADYDLVVGSDYVLQKMIRENMIVPFDDDSTPNYNKYVSPFVKQKMESIKVNGETGLVTKYARGYMWGTLGILYNDGFDGVTSRGITAAEMETDMHSWLSLWNKKYETLLSIKDSMRDTYAVGIMKTYDQDFTLDGTSYEGFSTLKKKYDAGTYTADQYNEKATAIFNLCDDTTLSRVRSDLNDLKNNAFGFEVDSGKTDMAKGDVFAINVAWSGDAAYAMDLADENNAKNADNKDFTPTILKYALPDTGANIWFDGWVMPSNVKHKELAEQFVDFISMPDNVVQNMTYIGYTSVIAGDTVLELVQSNYDMRWDADAGKIDDSLLEGYTKVESSDIVNLSDDDKASSYYTKDISYFFAGSLEEKTSADCLFDLTADQKDRQFDTQYPDSTLLPSLCVMADFGDQTDALLKMWEKVKNTDLPLWAYITIIAVIVLLIVWFVVAKIKKHAAMERRRQRKEAREIHAKKSLELLDSLTDGLFEPKKSLLNNNPAK
jgi:spermidine/putrescine transport system substrate-binding protein